MKTITLNMEDVLYDALCSQLEILAADGIKYEKEHYIMKMMQIGLLKTSIELINEGRIQI